MPGEQFHAFVSFDFWAATGEDAQRQVDARVDALPPDSVVSSQIIYVAEGKPEPQTNP